MNEPLDAIDDSQAATLLVVSWIARALIKAGGISAEDFKGELCLIRDHHYQFGTATQNLDKAVDMIEEALHLPKRSS